MKIAVLGSAPSSVTLAPFGDPSWRIFGCSPGLFPICPRVDAWFELHRWEPGVVGKPQTQKPWFSPEYVAWMGTLPLVIMADPVPELRNSRRLCWETLCQKYGSYNFTSSIAWMMAVAIEDILEAREQRATAAAADKAAPGYIEPTNTCSPELDMIGLWGVDMAATEEYGYQRAGCQFFVQLAMELNIQIVLPPESDLMLPPPLYGIFESSHMMIKMTSRKRELEARLANARATQQAMIREEAFLSGALDDINYTINTWISCGSVEGVKFNALFAPPPHVAPSPAVAAPASPDPLPAKVEERT